MNLGTYVHHSAELGEGVIIGRDTIIDAGCRIGNNVVIGDHCKLKSGTWLGDDVVWDDYSHTSGAVFVGNNVMVKCDCCITQGTIIEDMAFIGPGIMIVHEKNVSWQRNTEKISRGVYIRSGAVIGARATLHPGVLVEFCAEIGTMALVTKHCEAKRRYIGVPARDVGAVDPRDLNVLDLQIFDRVGALAWIRRWIPGMEMVGPFTL